MEDNIKLDEIIDILNKILEQLEVNNGYLQQLIVEKKYSEFKANNKFCESNRITSVSLDAIDLQNFSASGVLFVGYNYRELRIFLEKISNLNGVHMKSPRGLNSSGELVSIFNSLQRGDMILLDLRDIICIPEGISIIEDAIQENCLNVKIGQGEGTRNVRLPIKDLRYFFYSSEEVMPKELESCLSVIYVNQKSS